MEKQNNISSVIVHPYFFCIRILNKKEATRFSFDYDFASPLWQIDAFTLHTDNKIKWHAASLLIQYNGAYLRSKVYYNILVILYIFLNILQNAFVKEKKKIFLIIFEQDNSFL